MPGPQEHEDSAGESPAESSRAGTPAARAAAGSASQAGRLWRAWRRWRRSRPFWGGLLLILSGAELLTIPLPLAALGTIIHIGIGGVLGILIGAVLIVCGLLVWFHPAQRIFYSIVGILLALASLIATNLGGFLLGALLGVIGGSLAFAWTPGAPSRGRRRRARRAPSPAAPGNGTPEPGGKMLAVAAAPLVLVGLALAGQAGGQSRLGAASASTSPSPSVSGSPSPSTSVSSSPSPSPSPSPTSSPTPSPASTPASSPSPAPTGSPGRTPTPSPGPSAPASPSGNQAPPRTSLLHLRAAAVTPALTASDATSSLTAGSAALDGLTYEGVASVPTAGGDVQMLKFGMTSMTLSGGTVLTVTEGGNTMINRDSSLAFSGNVVLYTSQMSGTLAGVQVTFTPQSPPSVLPPNAVLTNVAADQPFTQADSLVAGDLQTTGG